MLHTEQFDFHLKYVDPYYGGLMKCNFLNKEIIDNPIEFLGAVRRLRDALSNEDILMFLNSSWRPSKVGAWIIGLCRIKELEKDLIQVLHNRPSYSEHIIINLTLLNSRLGNSALIYFLETQLEELVEFIKADQIYKAFNQFEGHSLIGAFCAIKYLDSVNRTNDYNTILNGKHWPEIKRGLRSVVPSNSRMEEFYRRCMDLQGENQIEEVIDLIKKLD